MAYEAMSLCPDLEFLDFNEKLRLFFIAHLKKNFILGATEISQL